jgi:homoserine dehydrogenase
MALGAQVTRIDDPGKHPPLRSQAAPQSSTRNVALLGFGTVGRAVADILCREPRLRLTHVFNRDVERKRVTWVPDCVQWTDNFHEVLKSDADVVIELMGGLDPAHQCIRQALQSGKSVVTANKHVMAQYGHELLELARQHGQQLEYGASVGGAVPVLAALRYGLAGDRIVRACGILNGTCNFILSKMEANGTTLATALAEAQRLGYAESDPSDDVNGVDAACKVAIVARMALQAGLNAFEIPKQSITGIQPEDFHYARQLGCTIRQISLAEVHREKLRAAVGPALISLKSPLAACVENQNAVVITGENSGDTLLAGRGAGAHPTAVAVVSDLLAIAHTEPPSPNGRSVRSYAPEQLSCQHYVRVSASKAYLIRSVLDDHGLRVEKWLNCLHQDSAAFLLQRCNGAAVQNAIAHKTGELAGALCLPVLNVA